MPEITPAQSGAFVELLDLPPTGRGTLDGLRFAVKDVIDVAGRVTGCGNPTWRDTHPPAAVHAVCVEQLLTAGARCVGRTVTDEMAYSLLGENHWHGTPLNPRAPERVPGGSSAGSVAAVACGLAEFALGTDTGGSIRIPASNCGILGYRPSHDRISVAGVTPLAPTFDTVGLFARTADVLARSAAVLLAADEPAPRKPESLLILTDAFERADAVVRDALAEPVKRLRAHCRSSVREVTLTDLVGPEGEAAEAWFETYKVVQIGEIRSCLGAWVEAANPEFGAMIGNGFRSMPDLDRTALPAIIARRQRWFRRLNAAIGPNDVLVMPTGPIVAPRKGSVSTRVGGEYFPRTLAATAVSGIGRLPEISVPVGRAGEVPVGLSLVSAADADLLLLGIVKSLEAAGFFP